jgi:hypothetical protein
MNIITYLLRVRHIHSVLLSHNNLSAIRCGEGLVISYGAVKL